jgi:hypothetical protein
MAHSRKLTFALLALVVLSVANLVFFPEVVSAWWHLRHGSSMRFSDWKVTVPWRWWAFTGGEQLIVQRMGRFYAPGDLADIVLGTLEIHNGQPVKSETLEKSQIAVMSRDGYVLRGRRDWAVNGHAGFCAEFAPAHDSGRIWIDCESPEAGLAVNFQGRESYRANFYDVLSQIKPWPSK